MKAWSTGSTHVEIRILHVYLCKRIPHTRDIHHPSLRRRKLVNKQVSKQKVSQMVSRKMNLDTIRRLCKLAHGHDACAVDEDIHGRRNRLDFRGGSSDRCVVGQVDLHKGDVDGRVRVADLFDDRRDLGRASSREDDFGGLGSGCEADGEFGA
jgi:hypothetical protein